MLNRPRATSILIRRFVLLAGLVAILTSLPSAQRAAQTPAAPRLTGAAPATGVMTVADYERALALQSRFENQVIDAPEAPTLTTEAAKLGEPSRGADAASAGWPHVSDGVLDDG